MDAIRELEVAINIFLQSGGPVLRAIMQAITFLGDELFYILFMPAIYWCVSAWAGLRIGVMLLLSGGVNSIFKLALRGPRPSWISDAVEPVVHETSFGIPSGHAQGSASVWGWVAVEARKKWVTITCLLLIALISFSRLVMGVHFLSDVLLGLILGSLLVLVFLSTWRKIGNWLKKLSWQQQVLLAFVSSLVFVALAVLVKSLAADWQMPADWAMRAVRGAKAGKPVNPMSINGALTSAGIWFGMLGGFAWLRAKHGVLQSHQGSWQKLARYMLGLFGVIALYLGLGQLFPKNLGWISDVLRYFRYFLIGLWISTLSPLLFVKLKIGQIEPHLEPDLTVEDVGV